jgi:hypothetical protein
MRELAPGVWYWPGLHPQWSEAEKSHIEQLRPPLEKPVEHVLAAHGGPFDRAALERALSR